MDSTARTGRPSRPFIADRRTWDEARLALRLLRDPRVGGVKYLLPSIAVLYLLSPIDLLPDFFPVVGQIDDLGVLVLMVVMVLRMIVWVAPPAVVAEHRDAIAGPAGRRVSAARHGPIYDVPFRVRE